MTTKKMPDAGGVGIGKNEKNLVGLNPNCTTKRPPIQFPYKTDLPGLLAQADDRMRRANSNGNETGAVAHLSVWFAIHPLVFGYGGE